MHVIYDRLSDEVFPSDGILPVGSYHADDWSGYTHNAYVRLLPPQTPQGRYQSGYVYGEGQIAWDDHHQDFESAVAHAKAYAKMMADTDAIQQAEDDARELVEA